jgi:hypothetical protein
MAIAPLGGYIGSGIGSDYQMIKVSVIRLHVIE